MERLGVRREVYFYNQQTFFIHLPRGSPAAHQTR